LYTVTNVSLKCRFLRAKSRDRLLPFENCFEPRNMIAPTTSSYCSRCTSAKRRKDLPPEFLRCVGALRRSAAKSSE